MSPKEKRSINGPEPAQKAAVRAHGGQARVRTGAIRASRLVGSRRGYWSAGGASPEQTPSSKGSGAGLAQGHHATKAFINSDFWEEGTNGFVRLIFPARDAFHFGEL